MPKVMCTGEWAVMPYLESVHKCGLVGGRVLDVATGVGTSIRTKYNVVGVDKVYE